MLFLLLLLLCLKQSSFKLNCHTKSVPLQIENRTDKLTTKLKYHFMKTVAAYCVLSFFFFPLQCIFTFKFIATSIFFYAFELTHRCSLDSIQVLRWANSLIIKHLLLNSVVKQCLCDGTFQNLNIPLESEEYYFIGGKLNGCDP